MAVNAFAAESDRNIAVARGSGDDQRIALVIGNSNYKSAPLANPVNDVRAVAAKLRHLGFAVIERENLGIRQIGATLREFRSKLAPGGVAVFFYAGHGLQVQGVNYLPAVDAEIASEEDVSLQSLELGKVLQLMDDAKTRLNLVFIDACRNNPYARSFRSATDGLARVAAPSGTLISFATRPGSVAADGSGRNGLYTEQLLAAMDMRDVPIELALKRVVSGVKSASKGRQEPWMEGSIEGDFCFGVCGAGTQVAALVPSVNAARTPQQIEDELWDGIRGSDNPAVFEEYLKQYPKGRYVAQARIKLAEFKGGARPSAAAAASGGGQTSNAEEVLWASVERGNTAADYEAYLKSYPNGLFAEVARARMRKPAPAVAPATPVNETTLWEGDVGKFALRLNGDKVMLTRTSGGDDDNAILSMGGRYPEGVWFPLVIAGKIEGNRFSGEYLQKGGPAPNSNRNCHAPERRGGIEGTIDLEAGSIRLVYDRTTFEFETEFKSIFSSEFVCRQVNKNVAPAFVLDLKRLKKTPFDTE